MPELQIIDFNAELGWNQCIIAMAKELPPQVTSLTIKFSLSNVNIRRRYSRLAVNQGGAPGESTELTDYFMLGPNPVPVFGLSTEVTIPWNDDLDNSLECHYSVCIDPNFAAQQQAPEYTGYASI